MGMATPGLRTVGCTVREYNDGSKKKYMTQGQRLVHCNFGWEGSHDGYYYVGAFNTAKSPVTLGVSSTGPNDFSNDNEIMMYML